MTPSENSFDEQNFTVVPDVSPFFGPFVARCCRHRFGLKRLGRPGAVELGLRLAWTSMDGTSYPRSLADDLPSTVQVNQLFNHIEMSGYNVLSGLNLEPGSRNLTRESVHEISWCAL